MIDEERPLKDEQQGVCLFGVVIQSSLWGVMTIRQFQRTIHICHFEVIGRYRRTTFHSPFSDHYSTMLNPLLDSIVKMKGLTPDLILKIYILPHGKLL